jgi:transcriptional regulator with XRE-family HTH domain
VALSGAMVSVPSIRRCRLGAALRRLRETSGMSLEAVAGELGWSTSKVSRIELAKIAVTPADVRALLGVLDALSDEVEDAGQPRQRRPSAGLVAPVRRGVANVVRGLSLVGI